MGCNSLVVLVVEVVLHFLFWLLSLCMYWYYDSHLHLKTRPSDLLYPLLYSCLSFPHPYFHHLGLLHNFWLPHFLLLNWNYFNSVTKIYIFYGWETSLSTFHIWAWNVGSLHILLFYKRNIVLSLTWRLISLL